MSKGSELGGGFLERDERIAEARRMSEGRRLGKRARCSEGSELRRWGP
jgi:hypothetical protein